MSRDNARLAARDMLRRARVDRPPVRIGTLARSVGVTVERVKLDPHVSSVLLTGKAPRIAVNRRLSRAHRRFAVAHALGHQLLHGERTAALVTDLGIHLSNTPPSRSDPREQEANAFALELLMPDFLLREDLAGEPVDLADSGSILRLSTRYRVAPALLALRALELGFVWAL